MTASSIAVLAIGGFIFSQLSYKICWRCDAEGFFNRGMEYSCSEKKNYRRTGIDFIGKAADQGHIRAELTLAELYSEQLPREYIKTAPEQVTCLRQDVLPDQSASLPYFESVTEAVEQGQEVDPVILGNLALLYLKGIVPAENPVARATTLYEKAAAGGSFSAMQQLGRLANDRGEYDRALKWFDQASADPADGWSPLMVGDYSFYGKGTIVDYEKAGEWYQKALARAGKADTETAALLRDQAQARLNILERRLSGENGRKQQVTISYHVDGSINHFMVYAVDHPDAYIGEVINDDGNISAAMNENLEFVAELQQSRQEKFSSMNEGLFWILKTFAAATTSEDTENLIFNFVLTKS